MATTKNLVIDQGATFSANIQFLDTNKNPISLAGYSVRSKMRTSYDAANAAPFTAVITNEATGNINLSLTAANTSLLQYGRYVYDVEAYLANAVLRIVEGTVTVAPGVSGNSTSSLFTGPIPARVSDLTTANVVETTNLYFTNTRANAAIETYLPNYATVSNLNLKANITDLTYNTARPAFRIYGSNVNNSHNYSSNLNLKGISIIVDYDQSNCFNQTTGYFTAPITGLYQVSINVSAFSGLSQVAVLRNNSYTPGNIFGFWEAVTIGQITHYGETTMAKLYQGDQLSANILTGNITFDEADNWSVTFIG